MRAETGEGARAARAAGVLDRVGTAARERALAKSWVGMGLVLGRAVSWGAGPRCQRGGGERAPQK